MKYTIMFVIFNCIINNTVMSDSLLPCGLQPARLLCPWDFPGNSTGVGCHFLLQGIFHCRQMLLPSEPPGKSNNNTVLPFKNSCQHISYSSVPVCMLSCFSRVRLFVTPWTVACQAPLPMGFPREEYKSGLPFPLPEDLPDLRIEPCLPHWQMDSLSLSDQESHDF